MILRSASFGGADRGPVEMGWARRYTIVLLLCVAATLSYLDRALLSVAIVPMAAEFGWDKEQQGAVLSAFFVGYAATNVVAGVLADRHGAKAVLLVALAAWSALTALTPLAARLGLHALIAARVGVGAFQGATYPSTMAMLVVWVPVSERNSCLAVAVSGGFVGTVIAMGATPGLIGAYGWAASCAGYGAAGLLYCGVFARYTSSWPQGDAMLTEDERALILAGAALSDAAAAKQVPWRRILSNRAVWAVCVANFCANWSWYVLLAWLPTYITEGLGVDYGSIGALSVAPYLAGLPSFWVAGLLADHLVGRGVRTTTVRRAFQAASFGGIGAALLLVPLVTSASGAVAVLAAGFMLQAATVGGLDGNHLDLAPEYVGAIYGLSNSCGTLPGIFGVYVSGAILERTGSWALVFQLAAAVAAFGAAFYLRYASGERQADITVERDV